MALNAKEAHWFILGCIAAAGNGAFQPLIAIFMSNMITVLSFPTSPTFTSQSDSTTLNFFILAICALFANMF
jgi:ATP-binding cassette subfamily B (MDR/TAP) protein 1